MKPENTTCPTNRQIYLTNKQEKKEVLLEAIKQSKKRRRYKQFNNQTMQQTKIATSKQTNKLMQGKKHKAQFMQLFLQNLSLPTQTSSYLLLYWLYYQLYEMISSNVQDFQIPWKALKDFLRIHQNLFVVVFTTTRPHVAPLPINPNILRFSCLILTIDSPIIIMPYIIIIKMIIITILIIIIWGLLLPPLVGLWL